MEERQDSLLEATRDRVSESQEIKVSRFRWHFQLKAGAKGRKRIRVLEIVKKEISFMVLLNRDCED